MEKKVVEEKMNIIEKKIKDVDAEIKCGEYIMEVEIFYSIFVF